MKIWFTSDTHFSSSRTLELSKRPFKSVEEMDKQIIDNWNSVVDKKDVVYHLGDFGNYEIAKELNGSIILIKGNYEKAEEDILMKNHIENFDMVISLNKVEFHHKGYNITLCHEPSKCANTGIDELHINLFGHVHKLCMIKEYGLNVGIDCHNFFPIDLDTVLFYHSAILNHYDSEVFN